MSLQSLTAELYQLFDQEDYEKCQKILVPIKVELIKHRLLVPTDNGTQNEDQLNDLKIAQRILEIGALTSLLTENYLAFVNYVGQLRPFYSSEKLHPSLAINTESTKIVSLYLLYLLSQGLISKFHVELEVLYNSGKYNVDKDKYLQFPVDLGRNLMEGSYNKIWKLLKEEKHWPCKEYILFIDTLKDALRFEIAKSIERTYDSIPIVNCKNLLYYPQELSDSVFEKTLKEDLEVEDWKFSNGRIIFIKNEEDLSADNQNIIADVLNYAEKIESII